MIIMKFGGSSVGSVGAMRQVAHIVGLYLDRRPVIVVSAMAGVTDALRVLHESRRSGDRSAIDGQLEKLRGLHLDTMRQVLVEGGDLAMQAKIELLLRGLDELARSPLANDGATERHHDEMVSFGERLSSVLVTMALRAAGLHARDFDARGFLFTDGQHGAANVNFTLTNLAAGSALLPYVEENGVPVVTGYIGSAPDGSVTTLNRGGSDYTATVLGAALAAEEVWLWKEEDGIMTADPRIVPDARLLPAITYREAAEMSYYGAKVLHPLAIVPVRRHNISIRVRNTFEPEAAGTTIIAWVEPPESGVRVITAIRELAMVTVEGLGMAGLTGIAAEVTESAKRAGVNIVMSMQAASEQNICLICRAADAKRLESALREDLRERIAARLVDYIKVEAGIAAVAVVGEGMRGRKGVAGRVFSSLCDAGVNVTAIVQGPSECNITFMTAEADAAAAVRAVHAAFRLGRTETEGPDESCNG